MSNPTDESAGESAGLDNFVQLKSKSKPKPKENSFTNFLSFNLNSFKKHQKNTQPVSDIPIKNIDAQL
jgi:hypothetical protein